MQKKKLFTKEVPHMGQNKSGHRLNTKGGKKDLLSGQLSLFDNNDLNKDINTVIDYFQLNINSLTAKYPYKNGKFGKEGKNCQVIITDTPKETSSDFFEKLTQGMNIESLDNGKGWKARSEDGTIITYRTLTSTPNSPAIDINIKKSSTPPLRGQKIHFETAEDQKKNEGRK